MGEAQAELCDGEAVTVIPLFPPPPPALFVWFTEEGVKCIEGKRSMDAETATEEGIQERQEKAS